MLGKIPFLRLWAIACFSTCVSFNGFLSAKSSVNPHKNILNKQIVINEIMYHPFHDPDEPENTGEEYIEIANFGNQPVNLFGWLFSNGIEFLFPDLIIGAGAHLVIAADVTAFMIKYPGITNVIGDWDRKLSNSGERIELENNYGETIDEVRYSDEGDWALRQLGQVDNNHRGWEWSDEHDEGGKSLELINPTMSIHSGQNWAASKNSGGTPGKVNSVYQENTAPLILNVGHSPVIPHSDEQVIITARIIDESDTCILVRLFYRLDGETNFNIVEMTDNAQNGDLTANDKLYTARIDPMPDKSIIEFYIEATDSAANSRTYPAPSMVDSSPMQATNLLYQVDDSFNGFTIPDTDPVYRIIMTEKERAELIDVIGSGIEPDRDSNAEMNATFISQDSTGLKKCYHAGVRVRGKGTRKRPPISLRVNFPNDLLWNDLSAVNLNTKFTHLQILGAALFKKAGLPAAKAKAVQVQVNGYNLALTETIPERMYGKYAYLEVINDDFASNHFPEDNGGNIYRCMRIEEEADLRYEGTDPNAYTDTYFKQTNDSEFDWTDLIHLTDVLNNTPDDTYVDAVSSVINVEQWMRWLAVEVMLSNNETNLSNGRGDDYYMYRGEKDTRFILLPHDLDTIFGQGREKINATNQSIWQPTQIAAIDRLLIHPVFITRYYTQLKDVIETIFEPKNFNALIAEVLDEWAKDEPVLDKEINLIKQFVSDRSKYILYGGYPRIDSAPQIPDHQFTIECCLPKNGETYSTTSSIITGSEIEGTADVLTTQSVLIDTTLADWNPIRGEWQAPVTMSFNLKPGLNQIDVSTFGQPDGKGNKLESGIIDIWYDMGTESTLFGTLTADTTLDAKSGPWYIIGDVFVPADIELTIEPGTSLFFSEGTGLVVQQGGQLTAEGSENKRIVMSCVPDSNAHWSGIEFHHSLEDNRLCYVDMEHGDRSTRVIFVNQSRLLVNHVTWDNTNKTIIEASNPSTIIRNSIFPSVTDAEPIRGRRLTGDQYFIIESNTFYPPTEYNDVIDFSNCQRPGPILQVYNNVFLGGGDDALDLDGCDAHIEGNCFMNFHKAHEETSTSNGIATDEFNNFHSHITVVRNIFYNNDHGVLLKGGAFLHAENNVFVNCSMAAINFGEYPYRDVEPGGGATLDGCIFWNNPEPFENQFAQPGEENPEITVHRSIIQSDKHDLGEGNLDVDPQFVDSTEDFHLVSSSPVKGKGPNGLDMGRYVPAGASISGEPDSITNSTRVILTIGGPGITHYSYSINDTAGSWSKEYAIDEAPQIELNDLTDGQSYIVYVKGKNSANVWQSQPDYAVSKAWKTDLSYNNELDLPKRFFLHQNVPNPFNQSTKITFEVPKDSDIKVFIYDLLGRKVRTLANKYFEAGILDFAWDGQDDRGSIVSTGIYIIQIQADNKVFTKKMVLLQ